jgi:hypothetical protein
MDVYNLDVAGWMVDTLGTLPEWLVIIIISMMPFVELRLALPIAIIWFDMNIALAFTICVVANMVPVPFILIFFKRVEKWVRRYPYWNRVIDKIFARTRKRASRGIQKYESIALLRIFLIWISNARFLLYWPVLLSQEWQY